MKKRTAVALGIVLCGAATVWAQAVVGIRAGTLSLTAGDVFVGAQPVRSTATNYPALKDGEILTTGRGRVEVLLASGAFLRMGDRAALRLLDSRLATVEVELQSGTVLVEIVEALRGGRIRIHVGMTTTELKREGLYRLESDPAALSVLAGTAHVNAGGNEIVVSRGRSIRLDDALSAASFKTNVDSLHRWSARRSFYLFVSSPEARARRTNWELTATGWSWNRDFGIRFLSPVAAREGGARAGPDEQANTDFQKMQDLTNTQNESLTGHPQSTKP